ncbi:MAG: 5'-nucleotidase C-terminal domain-containing protein [Bacteroidia bacterium]|nr:5'-nucleotidase C-terminal domain-containing protein [Bacteroidia bacterium]
MRLCISFFATLLLCFGSCTPKWQPKQIDVASHIINEQIEEAPTIQTLLRPYRDSLETVISEVIGVSKIEMRKGTPQGTLGNYCADVLLKHSRERFQKPIDVAILTNGGLRVPLPKGDITVGKIFELLPFDNELVLLTIRGTQMDSLLQFIYEKRGIPFSGMTLVLDTVSGKYQAEITGVPHRRERIYTIVLTDFLAKGGDKLHFLQNPILYVSTGVLHRDFMIDYIRQHPELNAQIDERIRFQTLR